MTHEQIIRMLSSFLIVIVIVSVTGLIVFLHERKYHSTIKRKVHDDEISEVQAEYMQAKVLKKRVHVYYVSQLNIPRSVTEFWVMFSIEDGMEREYSLSQELFERIEEGQEGTLVLLNDAFFDFGDGEDIEKIEK
jgi:hypothetical protein